MNNERERSVRTILAEIEYGRLSAEETERRLNRMIDRELCGPLDRPVNTDLVDLCSALILKLHGVETSSGSDEAAIAGLMDRICRSQRKTHRRRFLRPALIAAAVLIAVIISSFGVIRLQWFAGYSSEDQEQYIIEGHEITTGKTAVANITTYAEKDKSIRTDSLEELTAFLGFDPHLPQEIYPNYKPNVYFGIISGTSVWAECFYLNASVRLPEGQTASDNISDTILYTIQWYPSLKDDEYCINNYGDNSYDQVIEGVRVNCMDINPDYYCSWRNGNALLMLLAHKPEIDLYGIAASLIRAQAADPVSNGETDRLVDRMTSEAYLELIRLERGSDTFSGTSLKDLIRFTHFNPYLPETLCGQYTPQFYTASYARDEQTVTCDFYSGEGQTGGRITYTRTHFTRKDLRINDFIPPEARETAEQLMIRNTPVCRYEYAGMTVWLWTGYDTLYRLEAPTELAVTDQAVDEILDAYADQGRTKVLREAAEKAAKEAEAGEDGAAERQETGPEPGSAVPDAYEPRTITLEMIRNTLERHPQQEPLATDSLDELGEYLGYSAGIWDLSAFGWYAHKITAVSSSDTVSVLIRLFNQDYPEDEIRFSFHQSTEPENTRIEIEQNGIGTYDKILSTEIYKTANYDQNIYTWNQGPVVYLLRSRLPREVLDEVTGLLLGLRPEEDELPDEDEVYAVTDVMMQNAMAEREADGLPVRSWITRDMIIAVIEKHAAPPIDVLASGDLAELGDYLGVPVDHLSLEKLGWLVERTDAGVMDDMFYAGVRYFKASDPVVDAHLSFRSFSDISEAYFTVEQDGEGVYSPVCGENVYFYTNCGHNGCLWIDGPTIYLFHTDEPREVMVALVTELIRNIQAVDASGSPSAPPTASPAAFPAP